MVKMGSVWDRTVEVVQGRAAMLVSIAALTLWLPTVLLKAIALATNAGADPAAAPGGSGSGLLFALSLVGAGVAIFGQMALIAVASDPVTTRGEAMAIAARRLPVTIGLMLLLALAVFVALLPIVAPIAAAIPNPAVMTAESLGAAMNELAPGTRGFISLYVLVLLAVLVWVTARLALLNPVIVNEREGVASFVRSFALTRGLTWKIVGLLVLFGIVVSVVTLATRSVTGVVFSLMLGADNAGAMVLLTTAVGAVVTSGITVTWTAFVAQLYVAVRAARDPR